MQRTVEKVFFALIRFEINGDELCEEMKNLITTEMLPALFKLSKRHDLAHLIGDALDKNGLLPDESEAKKRFLQERNMAVYRVEQLGYEYAQVSSVLEELGAKYLPLKGAVLRQYYPENWMRTSADIDVLVHKEDVEKIVCALENELQYTRESESAYDTVVVSPTGFHVELHFDLITKYDNKKANEILGAVWLHVEIVQNSCRRIMPDDYFYYYHIAHMARHFIDGGCGVRPFLDVWLLMHKGEFDKEESKLLLESGELLEFAKAVEELAEIWFSKAPYNERSGLFERFILKGGVYGSIDNKIVIQQGKNGGRFRYILSRMFMPYEELKYKYPILHKHKYLYPLMLLRRWGSVLFSKERKRIKVEMQISADALREQQKESEKLIEYLGLSKV